MTKRSHTVVMLMRWMAVSCVVWVLWMDQSVYNIPRHGHASGVGEGASSGWEQLAVVASKAECEALRRDRIQHAARRDAAANERGRYPERFRFFCSPAVEDPNDK
jgi:hypothetical protein